MSLWARISQLPSRILDEVRSMYTGDFPIEVRHYLAHWIEEHLLLRPVPVDLPGACEDFLAKLINEVEKTALELPENIAAKTRLIEAAHNFRALRSVNPSQLYFNLIFCLEREQQYVSLPVGCPLCVGNPELHKVCTAIKELHDMARQIENDSSNFMKKLGLLPSDQQPLQIAQTNEQQVASPVIHIHNNVVEIQHANEPTPSCTRLGLALVDGFRKIITSTGQVQATVLNEYLVQWKTTKLLHLNDACSDRQCDLGVIQRWCESLAKILLTTNHQIGLAIANVAKRRMVFNVSEMLSLELDDVQRLLKTLISQTFIIEKQPPQVIKTKICFATSACLLVGNVLDIQTANPMVKVSIISDTQLHRALQSNKLPEQSCGELVRNTEQFEYNEATKRFSVTFPKLLLKTIQRSESFVKAKCVFAEKFSLVFQSTFNVAGDYPISVWTSFEPIVVIVHSSQEPDSWSTIIWDNALAFSGRSTFAAPETVLWSKLAPVLNRTFRDSTGRSLTPENMHYLCEKAFKTSVPSPAPNDLTITRKQFCKDKIPDRTFTCWEWFYAAMKLTRLHFNRPWNDGNIVRFISKAQAESYLLNHYPGTFLLRFSDSELGGVSIAWVHVLYGGRSQVLHLQPFNAKDLDIRSLSDRIGDIDDLFYLFPNNTPKHEAFHRSTIPDHTPRNKGYIAQRTRMVLELDDQTNNNPVNSIPTSSSNNNSLEASCSTAGSAGSSNVNFIPLADYEAIDIDEEIFNIFANTK